MALPLMPHRFIWKAFNAIKKEADIAFRHNPRLKHHFDILFAYYEKFWINQIGPKVFSIHNSFATTNNHSEGHNKLLNKKMGNKHINIWEFLGELYSLLHFKKKSLIILKYVLEKLCHFSEARTMDFKQAALIPFEGHAISEKHRVIAQNCKDLDNEVIIIEKFLHNIVAMKLSIIQDAIEYNPTALEIEDWEGDDMESDDRFYVNEAASSTETVAEEYSDMACSGKQNTSKICLVCLENAVETVFAPCGHSVTCADCRFLFEGDDTSKEPCIICESPISLVIVIRNV